jgi:hypothetical protein
MTATPLEVGFRPSEHGWHFANYWPGGAPAGIAGITLARVYGGLCGGMCVMARQAWERGTPLPTDRQVPRGGPLTSALWEAQLHSMDLPEGLLRYLRLQLPTAAAARRRSTLGSAVPAVRRNLRGGRPALLGLVRATSWNPAALSKHHVVLAYRLDIRRKDPDLPAQLVVIHVYDPNHPDDDRVRLEVTPDGGVDHSRSRLPVHAMVPLD